MLHSILTSLKKVYTGLWNGQDVLIRTLYLLQEMPQSTPVMAGNDAVDVNKPITFKATGLGALNFAEHQRSLPRDKWTICFAEKRRVVVFISTRIHSLV